MKGEDLIEGGYYILKNNSPFCKETTWYTLSLPKDTVLKCITRREAQGDFSYFLVEGIYTNKGIQTNQHKGTTVRTSDHTYITPYIHKDISSIDTRKYKIQAIETQITNCKKEIDTNNQAIGKLETKNKKLEDKISDMKTKLSKLKRFKSDEEEQAFAIRNFFKKVPGASVEQITEFLKKLKKD